tara:strand:- start:162 stop:311 length:150 start_codon:yes stop_codon:yes gene_type:complete
MEDIEGAMVDGNAVERAVILLLNTISLQKTIRIIDITAIKKFNSTINRE